MALAVDNNHAEAYNNLGVLELRRGHIEQARAFFQASFALAPQMYEPHYNAGMMSEWVRNTCRPKAKYGRDKLSCRNNGFFCRSG